MEFVINLPSNNIFDTQNMTHDLKDWNKISLVIDVGGTAAIHMLLDTKVTTTV